MKHKISIFLAVAMLALALTGVVAAQNQICCLKDCGTKVIQCDKETTFAYKQLDNPRIVVSTHETIYVDVDYDANDPACDRIAAGDIRLTYYHTNYPPNTKVGVNDGDNGDSIKLDDAGHPVVITNCIKFFDINFNGKYDIYDPVYIDRTDDLLGNGSVSAGDIRLTDVPPVDVFDDRGDLLYPAGSWELSKWTVATGSVAESDFGVALTPIFSPNIEAGNPADLLRYIDADCTGDWSCADKLYIIQPHWNIEGFDIHFDDFVTIGDLRLYIPPDDCMSVCGTKVQQGEKDVVYALVVATEAQLGYYKNGPEEVYVDMDANGVVSIGDVRLTSVSTKYDPNTKVKWCDYFDLGHELEAIDIDNIRYADIDDIDGYSLGDPVYVARYDLDYVSEGDIRLTNSPVFNIEDDGGNVLIASGEYGEAWSVVQELPDDGDVDWELEELPGIDDLLLGYIDSDCSGDWTCVDKLYLQQLVKDDLPDWTPGPMFAQKIAHDGFVTIGDIRLYIPQKAIDEECWEPCGTKVETCDKEITFALYKPFEINDADTGCPLDPIVGYVNRDAEEGFSLTDTAYIDMDSDGRVSDGDLRLTEVICKYNTYPPNSKVAGPHDEDLGAMLTYGGPSDYFEDWFGLVFFVDLNDNGKYDVEDPLYLESDFLDKLPGDIITPDGRGPSPGDIRLTDVPVVNGPYGCAGSVGEAWSRVEPNDEDTNFIFWREYARDGYYWGLLSDFIMIFDSDCSGTWTCLDVVYFKQPYSAEWIEVPCPEDNIPFLCPTFSPFVTAGDLRLYVPPHGCEPAPVGDVAQYDIDESGIIEKAEVYKAINDYFDDKIGKDLILKVIKAYLNGSL